MNCSRRRSRSHTSLLVSRTRHRRSYSHDLSASCMRHKQVKGSILLMVTLRYLKTLRTRCVEAVPLVRILMVVWITLATIVLKWILHSIYHKIKNTLTFLDQTCLKTQWCSSLNSDNFQSSMMLEWKQHLKVFTTRQPTQTVDLLLENLSLLAFLIHDARFTHQGLQDSLRTSTATRH